MVVRVVVVDDQDMVRSGFAALLSAQSDIDVGEAPAGRRGIEVCRSTRPDVVLMDIRMPEMDGLEAARRNPYFTASRAHAPEIYDRLNDVKRRLALGHPVKDSRDNPMIFFSLS
jgi:DNA-binding NarL/FixJ family response regulator